MPESDSLMHYGVKGQKWGVRRYQNEDGTFTQEGRERYQSKNGGNAGSGKKGLSGFGAATRNVLGKARSRIGEAIENKRNEKNPSRMSDQELRDKINRMNMEKQYKQLVSEMNKKPEKASKKWREHPMLKQILVGSATAILGTIVRKEMETRVDEVLSEKRYLRAERLKKAGKMFYTDPDKLKPFTYFGEKKKKP